MEKKIMIVEDNEDDLLIMTRVLNQAGITNLVSSENVASAILLVKEAKPDIVITDTLLPDGNGFDVCEQIKESELDPMPKIIVITGSVDAVDAVKAKRVGADDYCAKTSDCIPLVEALKKLL